ncbi:MAG: VWA domain-containing protein [Planctomycetes bacterium]|nr:VWA domain-containing protein [Planctomycetota bacterium]
MSRRNSEADSVSEDRYQGFSLKSVCWGYRDIFKKAIEGLFSRGSIGEHRREVTTKVFELLKRADQSCFDHILKEFLKALNPRTRWLMDLPSIFEDIVDLGRTLGESRLYYGTRFFETLGSGGFGDSPGQVRALLTTMRRLRRTDEDLAIAFMKGYRRLIDRLTGQELELYVKVGLDIFARNKKSGLAFMDGTLKTSEVYIRSITQEWRLGDVQDLMARMLKALVGYEIEINDLTKLDSDDLIERGSSIICMYKWLYLPQRIRYFDDGVANRDWYLLVGVVAAGMLVENSFCRIHGHPVYTTCSDVVGDNPLRINLFQIIEHVRVLRRIKKRWPGAKRLVEFGLRKEFQRRPEVTAADRLFHDAASSKKPMTRGAGIIIDIADESINLFDTVRKLDGKWVERVLHDYPGLDSCELRTFSFIPDFLFPGSVSLPPRDSFISDLKAAIPKRAEDKEKGLSPGIAAWEPADSDGAVGDKENDRSQASSARFVYDEWSQEENDYYRDYCFVREDVPKALEDRYIPPDLMDEARKVSRVFERLKPDLVRREKYLSEGDVINSDLLLEYLVQRRKEPAPKINFYEKPLINHRDLAVVILLDVSGSTGGTIDQSKKVLDVEKHAALILGQGLASLGDRFSICGFSSNGRENCLYLIYKEFGDAWSQESISRVLSAYPSNSTRIGPALRHAGYRLSRIDAKQRLIILVTDGKPMDSGYDPNTRYAQHDVRMACEENLRQGTHTFGISTEENSITDMEIMFPQRRFVILPDIRRLPRLLPKLYVRLTT